MAFGHHVRRIELKRMRERRKITPVIKCRFCDEKGTNFTVMPNGKLLVACENCAGILDSWGKSNET